MAMQPILVTGAAGLIGVPLARALRGSGRPVRCLDLHASAVCERDDVRDAAAMRQAVADCSGVIHLAAVSRVAWAERDPESCWQTNVHGTRNVLAAAQLAASRPWVVVASSREVYGRAARLPVSEDAPLNRSTSTAAPRRRARGSSERRPAAACGLRSSGSRTSTGGSRTIPTGSCRRSRALRRKGLRCGSADGATLSTSPTSTMS